ncbi:hypothetical protein [Streptomyces hyaluromycini]|uniref:hypothetical protein n=1 Tax=Streptomyces hyaluromycini TaxID=1377993 RepID=UPI00123802FC|nr:hypothetical protein [Streptomyces hyaluromycini]
MELHGGEGRSAQRVHLPGDRVPADPDRAQAVRDELVAFSGEREGVAEADASGGTEQVDLLLPRGRCIASSCLREIFTIRSAVVTGAFESFEELTADGTLEAPLGVTGGLAPDGSAGDVRLRGRVQSPPDQTDGVQHAVELPVAAAADPVPVGRP